jgi:hypothetical protein
MNPLLRLCISSITLNSIALKLVHQIGIITGYYRQKLEIFSFTK